jgi:catechol 2,3-dioxygenase
MATEWKSETEAQTPCGLNYLVLNVRDLETSHHFWTKCLGFRQVGTSRRNASGGKPMRFYSGVFDGKLHHHDIALAERSSLPADLAGRPQALNHVAIPIRPKRPGKSRSIFSSHAARRFTGR